MRMRKVISGVAVLWLFAVAGSLDRVDAQAVTQTESREISLLNLGGDFSLTVGLDIWPNQWVKSSTTFPLGGAHHEQQSALGVAFIPTATLTYQRFFLSAGYTVTPDYHFGESSTVVASTELVGFFTPGVFPARLQTLSTTASRQEADLTFGYFPLNWLGVAIGYKGIFQRFDSELHDANTGADLGSGVSRVRYNGLTVGVLASARIDDHFSLLGNAFGGYLFVNCSPVCASGDSPYTAAKLVVRYAPLPQLSVTLGYRVQIIHKPAKTNDELAAIAPPGTPTTFDTSSAVDLTHGPVIGVNYRF